MPSTTVELASQLAFYGLIYKLGCLSAGTGCVAMGWSLFSKGVYKGGAGFKGQAQAGGNEAAAGWKTVIAMDRGGPGLLFAMFGAAVIVVALLMGDTTSYDGAAVHYAALPQTADAP